MEIKDKKLMRELKEEYDLKYTDIPTGKTRIFEIHPLSKEGFDQYLDKNSYLHQFIKNPPIWIKENKNQNQNQFCTSKYNYNKEYDNIYEEEFEEEEENKDNQKFKSGAITINNDNFHKSIYHRHQNYQNQSNQNKDKKNETFFPMKTGQKFNPNSTSSNLNFNNASNKNYTMQNFDYNEEDEEKNNEYYGNGNVNNNELFANENENEENNKNEEEGINNLNNPYLNLPKLENNKEKEGKEKEKEAKDEISKENLLLKTSKNFIMNNNSNNIANNSNSKINLNFLKSHLDSTTKNFNGVHKNNSNKYNSLFYNKNKYKENYFNSFYNLKNSFDSIVLGKNNSHSLRKNGNFKSTEVPHLNYKRSSDNFRINLLRNKMEKTLKNELNGKSLIASMDKEGGVNEVIENINKENFKLRKYMNNINEFNTFNSTTTSNPISKANSTSHHFGGQSNFSNSSHSAMDSRSYHPNLKDILTSTNLRTSKLRLGNNKFMGERYNPNNYIN